MTKKNLPIPIHQIAFLQAYLYEIFSSGKKCKKNFQHTEWYLKEKFTDKEVELVFDFFNSYGLKCDCDIINKFDIKEIVDGQMKFHD